MNDVPSDDDLDESELSDDETPDEEESEEVIPPDAPEEG